MSRPFVGTIQDVIKLQYKSLPRLLRGVFFAERVNEDRIEISVGTEGSKPSLGTAAVSATFGGKALPSRIVDARLELGLEDAKRLYRQLGKALREPVPARSESN